MNLGILCKTGLLALLAVQLSFFNSCQDDSEESRSDSESADLGGEFEKGEIAEPITGASLVYGCERPSAEAWKACSDQDVDLAKVVACGLTDSNGEKYSSPDTEVTVKLSLGDNQEAPSMKQSKTCAYHALFLLAEKTPVSVTFTIQALVGGAVTTAKSLYATTSSTHSGQPQGSPSGSAGDPETTKSPDPDPTATPT